VRYYYDFQKIDSSIYADTKSLKEELESSAEDLLRTLSTEIKNLRYYWTKKSTFGYIFANYEHEKGKVIGKGEKALYLKLKDDYDFVILSNRLDGKYKKISVGEKHGIQINILYFKRIFQKVGDANKIVELFISSPSLDEIELETLRKLVRDPEKQKEIIDVDLTTEFLRTHSIENKSDIEKIMKLLIDLSQKYNVENADDLQKILDMTIRFIKTYQIQNPAEFEKAAYYLIDIIEKHGIGKGVKVEKIVAMVTKLIKEQKINEPSDLQKLIEIRTASEETIKESRPVFEAILEDFRKKIDSDIDEIEIRNFVFENMWLVDFQYLNYKKVKEDEISVGDIDISLHSNQLGTNSIAILEFKKPSKEIITTNYRGEEKPAILAEVGKALSQTIHYIENKKQPYRIIEGIVIMGRKKELKDEFINNFNTYLHGIKILTFDDLYRNAKTIVEAFGNSSSTSLSVP